jgi:hypothetical protein
MKQSTVAGGAGTEIDILGTSGRAILTAVIAGETAHGAWPISTGRLKASRAQLVATNRLRCLRQLGVDVEVNAA